MFVQILHTATIKWDFDKIVRKKTLYTVYHKVSPNNINYGHVLVAFAKVRKSTVGSFLPACLSVRLPICLSVRPSVRRSVRNNSVTTEWNFLKHNKAHALCCRITKATNRHSEHVILVTFPLQQRLRERTSIRRYMHIACIVTYKERNGYWFCVCRFYMNCTALRHTYHSNTFI